MPECIFMVTFLLSGCVLPSVANESCQPWEGMGGLQVACLGPEDHGCGEKVCSLGQQWELWGEERPNHLGTESINKAIFFFFLFHYGLSQDIEYSSLCYTVGLCCLSTLYILGRFIYVCSVISNSFVTPWTVAPPRWR